MTTPNTSDGTAEILTELRGIHLALETLVELTANRMSEADKWTHMSTYRRRQAELRSREAELADPNFCEHGGRSTLCTC